MTSTRKYLARRRRLRGQLALSGLAAGTAAWQVAHGDGVFVWTAAAVLSVFVLLFTLALLDHYARAYRDANSPDLTP
jgi:hypothetical protein